MIGIDSYVHSVKYELVHNIREYYCNACSNPNPNPTTVLGTAGKGMERKVPPHCSHLGMIHAPPPPLPSQLLRHRVGYRGAGGKAQHGHGHVNNPFAVLGGL